MLKSFLFVICNVIVINIYCAQRYAEIEPNIHSAYRHMEKLVRVIGHPGPITRYDSTLTCFRVSNSKQSSLMIVIYGEHAIENAQYMADHNVFMGRVEMFRKKPAIYISSDEITAIRRDRDMWLGDPNVP